MLRTPLFLLEEDFKSSCCVPNAGRASPALGGLTNLFVVLWGFCLAVKVFLCAECGAGFARRGGSDYYYCYALGFLPLRLSSCCVLNAGRASPAVGRSD